MARITPKTNWVASDIPVATDFNRIENNSEQAFSEIDAEVAARIADVDAEEAARIAADNSIFQIIKNNFATGPGNYIINGFIVNGSTNSNNYVKLAEIKIVSNINLRIFLEISGQYPFVRIYKNGNPYGTERTIAGTYQEDLAFSENDLIQLYAKTGQVSFAATAKMTVCSNGTGVLYQ